MRVTGPTSGSLGSQEGCFHWLKEFPVATWLWGIKDLVAAVTTASNLDSKLCFVGHKSEAAMFSECFRLHVHKNQQREGLFQATEAMVCLEQRLSESSSCFCTSEWEKFSHTSLQHKAVKDVGGQRGATALSCLHTTCKAMNLSNSSQVSRKQTFTTDFIKAVNLLALTLVPVAVSASLEKPLSYPGKN